MQSVYRTEYLPEFQNYLRERKLALENRIPFLARWVHLFTDFVAHAGGEALPLELASNDF